MRVERSFPSFLAISLSFLAVWGGNLRVMDSDMGMPVIR